jgi:hypothetical protein
LNIWDESVNTKLAELAERREQAKKVCAGPMWIERVVPTVVETRQAIPVSRVDSVQPYATSQVSSPKSRFKPTPRGK